MMNRLKGYAVVVLLLVVCFALTSCGTISVTLTDNGKTKAVEGTAGTVGDFLEENGIKLGKHDKISMDLDAQLQDGGTLEITRVKTRNITRTKAIDFEKEVKYTDELYKGQTKVETEGVTGQKEITYYYKYVNGYLETKKAIDEKVVRKPTNEVTLVGTKERPSAQSSSGSSGSSSGPGVVSRQKVYDCDGSGHGYYVIKYSDGSVKYQDF